jgi:hypothetical protein
MSGEREGQDVGSSLPIHLSGNVRRYNERGPAQSPFHKQLTEKRKDGRFCHLLAAKRKLPEFTIICRKPHMASSICLRAISFQTPEGTLWTHVNKYTSSPRKKFKNYILRSIIRHCCIRKRTNILSRVYGSVTNNNGFWIE